MTNPKYIAERDAAAKLHGDKHLHKGEDYADDARLHFMDGADWGYLRANNELCAVIDLALVAIKFYADEKMWKLAYRSDLKEFVAANSDGTSVIETDHGAVARTHLAKIKTLIGQKD